MARKQVVNIDPSSGSNNSSFSELSTVDLSDVKDSVTPVDGDILVYSGSENLYIPQAVESGSGDVVDDTTPQLGGNLDLNSSDITGTGNIDIDGDISATLVKSDLEGAIHFNAQAAENILKGEIVYVSGISGNTPLVSKARADSSTTMPAFGIASENINLNNTGNIATLGSQAGLDVSNFGETGIVFSLGDTLYVSSSESGKITNVSPSGESNFIQNIGKIERETPTGNMTIKVGGAGRSNATPALDDGNIFIGDSNNRSVTSNLQTLVESYSINSVMEDTAPQLGGSLDVNGNSITSVSNGDVTISPNGTGSLVVNSNIDMGTNSITDVKVGNWDTAYGWGDHSTAGYSTTDTNTFRTVVAGGNTLGSSETLTLTSGTNVSITESAGTVTIGSTDTNTQLSNEEVQDIIGGMVTGNTEANISVTYDDTTGKLNFSATDTNTQLSNEEVQDIVGAMVTGNTESNISVTYDDSTGKLNFSVTAATGDITSVELDADSGSVSDTSGAVSFGILGGDGMETSASGSNITVSVSQETAVIDVYHATNTGINLANEIQRYGFSDITLIRSSGSNIRVQIDVDRHYNIGDTIYILNDIYVSENTDITIEAVLGSSFVTTSGGSDFKSCFKSNYSSSTVLSYNGQDIKRIDFSSVSTSVTSSEAILLGKSKRIKLVCIETDESGHTVFSVTKA